MIIADDSPLRNLPQGLDRRQVLFFDGIRFSVEMADLSSSRLQHTLFNLATTRGENVNTRVEIASAMLDAWSLVDSCHRLRELLDQLPGMKKNEPALQVFNRRTKPVEDLRHFVQHLRNDIDKLVAGNLPVWGTLSWFTSLNGGSLIGRNCIIVAGTLFDAKHEIVNPLGEAFESPIGLVTLAAGGISVCLSDVIADVAKIASSLEVRMSKQFTDLQRYSADTLICLDLIPLQPSSNAGDGG